MQDFVRPEHVSEVRVWIHAFREFMSQARTIELILTSNFNSGAYFVMKELHKDHLQVLSQLAHEYHQKSTELESFLKDFDPQQARVQLRIRSEMTTNNFRLAQQALLSEVCAEDGPASQESLGHAAMALCRCFDEMRILFNAMAEKAETPKT